MKRKNSIIGSLGLFLVLMLFPGTIAKAITPIEEDTGKLEGEIQMTQDVMMTLLVYQDDSKSLLLMAQVSEREGVMKVNLSQNWEITDVSDDKMKVRIEMENINNATGSFVNTHEAHGSYDGEKIIWENDTQETECTPSTETETETEEFSWNETYIPLITEDFGGDDEENEFQDVMFVPVGEDALMRYRENLSKVIIIQLEWDPSHEDITLDMNNETTPFTTNLWKGTNDSTIELDPVFMFGGDDDDGDDGPPSELLEVIGLLNTTLNCEYNYFWDNTSKWLLKVDNNFGYIIDDAYEGDFALPTETEPMDVWLVMDIYVKMDLKIDAYFTEASLVTRGESTEANGAITNGFTFLYVAGLATLPIIIRTYRKR